MLVLAFDTATPAVTVALGELADAPAPGQPVPYEVVAQSTSVDARRHGELLAPAIDAVLRTSGDSPADLGAVVVGVGPGPFTGLRVGLVTARMLEAVLGIPAYGVCTLDALAYEADLTGAYIVATDARRREVYWAAYDGPRRVGGPHVGAAASVERQGPTVGQGAMLYPAELGPAIDPELPSAAAFIGHLASGRQLLDTEPLYLRRPDTAEPSQRKQVLT